MDAVAVTGLSPPQRRELHEEWGAWLARTWDWDWFVTLTFDQSRARDTGTSTRSVIGWNASARRWDEWLRGALGDSESLPSILPSVFWLRGREPNKNNAGTHFHALVGGVPTGTSRRRAWELWRASNGLARIEPVRSTADAGAYVSKYVVKQLGELVFSPNLADFAKQE